MDEAQGRLADGVVGRQSLCGARQLHAVPGERRRERMSCPGQEHYVLVAEGPET